MILTIISLLLNGFSLYLHLTASSGIALAILIIYIVPLYCLGAITGIFSLIKSLIKKVKLISLILSIISILISAYGLITIL